MLSNVLMPTFIQNLMVFNLKNEPRKAKIDELIKWSIMCIFNEVIVSSIIEFVRDHREIYVLAKFENALWKVMDIRALKGLPCLPPTRPPEPRQYSGALKGCRIKQWKIGRILHSLYINKYLNIRTILSTRQKYRAIAGNSFVTKTVICVDNCGGLHLWPFHPGKNHVKVKCKYEYPSDQKHHCDVAVTSIIML